MEICDVVLRLLAASVVQSVRVCEEIPIDNSVLINAPTLACLMEHCMPESEGFKILESRNG
jgi:hypothetical protein